MHWHRQRTRAFLRDYLRYSTLILVYLRALLVAILHFRLSLTRHVCFQVTPRALVIQHPAARV